MPMKNHIIITAIVVILLVLTYALVSVLKIDSKIKKEQTPIVTTKMLLTSPAFENNGSVPSKYSCDGGNHNPALSIQYVPETAKSLALIMHDPDAPIAGGFTHWLVWNINPKISGIKEESVPPGISAVVGVVAGSVEGKNDAGKIGYIGPCPPSGTHHYHFKLYALDAILDLSESSDRSSLEKEIGKHLLAEAELIGTYARKQ